MAKAGDPNHGKTEVYDFSPEDLRPHQHYDRQTTPQVVPPPTQDKSDNKGLSTLELATYLFLILTVGVIGFFITPLLPDEIAVQITLALIALLRQRYLTK